MKRRSSLILSVVMVPVVAALTLFTFVYFRGIGTAAEPVKVPVAATYVRPTATPISTATPFARGPIVGAPTPTPAPVAFRLFVEQSRPPESSVFLNVSVNVYLRAQAANLGDFDGHHVTVTARARVGADYVAIDGKEALVVPLGTLGARSAIVKDLSFTLTMSLSQGRTAQTDGILFEIVTSSDEATSNEPLMRCAPAGCGPA